VALAEEFDATIEGLRPYLVHNERFAVMYYSRDGDPETIHQAQLSEDALPDGLRVGDRVRIYAMLGVVAQVSRNPG
jgi:hypothetical protein